MAAKKARKEYSLEVAKVRRVMRYLGAKTEEEGLEMALDLLIGNDVMDRAHEKLIKVASKADKSAFVDTLGRVDR